MSTNLTTISGATMGTRFVVQFMKTRATDLDQVAQDLLHAVTCVDQQMSPWIKMSFVNTFNEAPVGEWMQMPKQAAFVINRALDIERKSGGSFSIAVAPQVRHHGFSNAPPTSGVSPKMSANANDALELSGTQIRKISPIEIDLCGIAKGYGVDALADVLIAHRIQNFMVSIDGEVRCLGEPEIGRHWQVAIEEPLQDIRQTAVVVRCVELSIATSGGYRNFERVDKNLLTHTVNPTNGATLSDTTVSVSVAHETCCDADAWATALLVMPIEDALVCIQKHRLNVLFLKRAGDETLCSPHGIFV